MGQEYGGEEEILLLRVDIAGSAAGGADGALPWSKKRRLLFAN